MDSVWFIVMWIMQFIHIGHQVWLRRWNGGTENTCVQTASYWTFFRHWRMWQRNIRMYRRVRDRGWHWLRIVSCPVEDKSIEIPSYRTTKGKAIHVRAHSVPGGWATQISRQSPHMKYWGCEPRAPIDLTPQEIFLLLISVRGWVDSRIIDMGLCQWKIPTTPSGIEPPGFQREAHFLNHRRPLRQDR
jgi:hypothetical protein